ncbi:MerR family transcriptional regulator [Hyphococcus sp.]|jgi:chaperone modulatory protein CbpM|uniref:MerR family transcriptional regulator n=1 Tax=Hyphococcus sp. TaxID=2038636 RepID=UPI003D0DCC8F
MNNETTITYTEDDLVAEIRSLTQSRLRRWLREGYVRPRREAGDALYDELDRARLELMTMLCDDFDVADDALSIFLGYLDQVHSLRREMARLFKALDRQPEAVRAAILRQWRDQE